MVPLTCDVREFNHTKIIIERVHAEILGRFDLSELPYKLGTMIEIPRAALLADKMAASAEFFSFGTNDLTQMTFGFSRDDIGNFMTEYLDQRLLNADPFQTLDQDGVGALVEMASAKGRSVGRLARHLRRTWRDPPPSDSIRVGLDYVRLSPFGAGVSVAAAQAAIKPEIRHISAWLEPIRCMFLSTWSHAVSAGSGSCSRCRQSV